MKILSLVFMILGTFLGAGFVSGKEVATYFSSFGYNSIWIIFVTTLLFFVLIYLFLTVSNRVNSFISFANFYFGKFAKLLTLLFSICLLIFISSMFAGNRELSKLLNLNKWILTFLTGILCLFVVLKNAKGISIINMIFIPVILIVILFNCFTSKIILPSTMQINILSLFTGINYVFINIVSLGVFLIEIGGNFTKKEKLISSIISSLIVGFFLVLINNKICLLNISDLSMPMIYIAYTNNSYLYLLTIISIWIGLFTTLISCVFIVSKYINQYVKQKILSVLITIVLGILISLCGFDFIVGYVYLIIGGVGVLMFIRLLFKEKEIYKFNHIKDKTL